ncbi:TetR/AcrR family transcriptional regulator [Amycolatopsis anabasis]|uniref:TetR/AcrR family transcriptional regulator n=1 Tax=Amycolatopsis anabasis TaxID=1840409 RepID=UPI00131E368D|nr:TetR/AcrR family transcriptional regulator [Amycolatopsis anabasis]
MRKPRADSIRNRAEILRAARALLAADGPAAGMDEIAREAGVAVGTLYRHFPTKTDLVGAIMAELAAEVVGELDAALARITGGGRAWDEIAALLHRVVVDSDDDRALREAATNLGAYSDELELRAREAVSAMVTAGHREGTVAPEVTADDLALLMKTQPPAADRRRWAELALRAIAAR